MNLCKGTHDYNDPFIPKPQLSDLCIMQYIS